MKMQYVTSIERIGMKKGEIKGEKKGEKKGIEKGVLKKARETVIDVLEARFEAVPTPLISKIKKIKDTSILKMLHKNAIFVGSVNEFNEIMSQTHV
jgi:predicted transposase YdaD